MWEIIDPALILDQYGDERVRHWSEFRFAHVTHMVHELLPVVGVGVAHVLNDGCLVVSSVVVAFVLDTVLDVVNVSFQMCNLLIRLLDVWDQDALLVFEDLYTVP